MFRLAHEGVNLAIVARRGIIRPVRPVRAARIGLAALRWGFTPGMMIAAAAAQHGERCALTDTLGDLSFVDLHERSDALAAAFAARGIRAGDQIGLLCRNHRGFVDALLALSKLGADILLLNTAFSADQTAAVLAG